MKINCVSPNHEDKNASLHIYPEYSHCFSCGYRCKTEELLNAEEIEEFKKQVPEKENLEETIKYIESLPRRKIRGLQLPVDSSGYYIIWPDRSFYKKRLWSGNSRYIAPIGHRPPILRCDVRSNQNKEILIVVEGELNLLSLDLALGDCGASLVSPGSASSLQGHIDYYCQYKRVIVVVDRDPAGVVNGLELKKELLKRKKHVSLIAVDRDFNDTLQKGGPEAVKQQFMMELGLL